MPLTGTNRGTSKQEPLLLLLLVTLPPLLVLLARTADYVIWPITQ
jgi:hypothetical protein